VDVEDYLGLDQNDMEQNDNSSSTISAPHR
jgi:hypothetical protein